MQTDRSLRVPFIFELSSQSGRLWHPPGPENAPGCQKVAPAAHPTTKTGRLELDLIKCGGFSRISCGFSDGFPEILRIPEDSRDLERISEDF